jgi:hypothetical protein
VPAARGGIDLAFADVYDFRLLCPYDVATLPGEVVHEARCSHPAIVDHGCGGTTWALVVDGVVYVRAANGSESSWYKAAINQRAGRVRIAGNSYEVTFEPAGVEVSEAIDAAYETKYPGSSAVPVMQGDGPKSATVRISPR